jgi:hypothetical protein
MDFAAWPGDADGAAAAFTLIFRHAVLARKD